MGSAVAMTLTTVSRDPNMVIFYASLSSGMAATGLVFYCIFRNMKDLPTAEEKAIIGESTPVEELGNAELSEAATRQLHLSLEPPSQTALPRTANREYKVVLSLAKSLPSNRQDSNLGHVPAVDPTTSSNETTFSSSGAEHTRHVHNPTPMPLHPSSAVLQPSPGHSPSHSTEVRDNIRPNNKTSSWVSSRKSDTSQSSGYDTADEYAPRSLSPA